MVVDSCQLTRKYLVVQVISAASERDAGEYNEKNKKIIITI
jgi:hypothetical protein